MHRSWGQKLKHTFFAKIAILIVFLVQSLCAQIAVAQTSTDDSIVPEFTQADLEVIKNQVSSSEDLTDEQVSSASESLDVAISALARAAEYQVSAKQFDETLAQSPSILRDLRAEIKDAQEQTAEITENSDIMTGDTLFKLEQDLIAKDVQLRTLRTDIQRYEDSLQELTQNQLRDDLSSAQNRLDEINEELGRLGSNGADQLQIARRYSLEARQYLLRSQIASLEREITSLPARQLTLGLRRDLANIKAQRVQEEVIDLQDKTGRRRLADARTAVDRAESEMSAIEKAHPFVQEFASENVLIGRDLLEIEEAVSTYPRLQAEARRKRDAVKNDLDVATRLTELGQINRQSSATLRRLRNQRAPVSSVTADITQTRQVEIDATQQRLWSEEQLRLFPVGQFNRDALLGDWLQLNPGAPEFSVEDDAFLLNLYNTRRSLLQEMSDASFSLITEAETLETTQVELQKFTAELADLLNQKLLWLPSVRSVDLGWPERAARGATKVFSSANLSSAFTVFKDQITRFWVILLFFGLLLFVTFGFRKNLREEIIETANNVGRVQKDSYWNTPNTLIASAIIAAPIPLLVFVFGVLFKVSDSPDLFIDDLGQTGIELSGFLWFFLMWGEWCRDRGLFDAHYKLPVGIRHEILRQLRWFIPFAAVFIALVTLTQNSREPDIYEGFSLFAFIVAAILLAAFGFRILRSKRKAIKKALSENDLLWRYRHGITFIVVALPLLAAILAAAGYYDTARELLSRLFFSAGLVIATYALYGLLRRSVLVAQRRLSLKHAIERREQVMKAKAEQEAAESRGEVAPPLLNYEEIDVESLSRQSVQLINTFIVLGFAILMWVFWQDLFPALSIFDEVRPFGDNVEVSLWNIIQALAIAVLTFISAKNLPGFLEVFVLNRSKLDRGTRYAIVSVLGYIIMGIGIVWAFDKLGMQWSQLQWIAAALSVGIGFGLQEIIANFISGLIILFERPIRVGDYITIGTQSGTVQRIRIRATTLSDLDNREIFIPNKELITQKLMNWTLTDSITRIIIPVGIAYGSDTDKAREIMLDVINSNSRVLEKPKSNVFFLGFGDSSLDFELRIFVRSVDDRFAVSHDIHTEINKALEKAGITIPFPQRDLHIISNPGSAPA